MTVKELKEFLNKIADEDTQIFVRNDKGFFEVAENAYVDHEGDILITNWKIVQPDENKNRQVAQKIFNLPWFFVQIAGAVATGAHRSEATGKVYKFLCRTLVDLHHTKFFPKSLCNLHK